ncbi:MAG: AI-2E family transporter, partial [Gammaproteobacteria bacterium]|nr:AI-2E family transporter [Gammaproteobacteria bacterium]
MFKIFRGWLDHLFADEQALLLIVLLVSGGIILAVFGSMLAPVFASLILAYLTLGLVQWLERFGVRHLPAVWGIYTLFLLGLGYIVLVLVPLVWRQAVSFLGELPVMAEQLQGLLLLLPEQYPQLVSKEQVQSVLDSIMSELANGGQLLVSFSLASIGQSIALLIYLILVPILVFFFLKDGQKIMLWFAGFLPSKRVMLSSVWHEMDDQLANYVRGKVVEILIVGISAYILFLVLGLNYAVLLALLVGFSVLIPYIGA